MGSETEWYGGRCFLSGFLYMAAHFLLSAPFPLPLPPLPNLNSIIVTDHVFFLSLPSLIELRFGVEESVER